MKDSVSISWLTDMAFEAEVNGHKMYIDASAEHGGKNLGPRPKPLLLLALAGCTGMDVVSILKKMRVEFDSFEITVEGNLTEEHPKKYDNMRLIYLFKGKDIPRDKVEKAVDLSRERYCGVSAMYSEILKLEYEIVIENN
jgi:putative redox protein